MPSPSESRKDYGVLRLIASQPDAEVCGAVSEPERVVRYGIAIGPHGDAISTAHRMDTHDVSIRGYNDAARGCIEVNRNRLTLHDGGVTCDGQYGEKVGSCASDKSSVANAADLGERDKDHDRYHRQHHAHFYEGCAFAHQHSPCWRCGLYTKWRQLSFNQKNALGRNTWRIGSWGGDCDRLAKRGEVMKVATHSAIIASVLLVAISAACTGVPSGSNEAIGATVLEMSEAITSLQQSQAELQEQIDSLRSDIARQDSLVRQVANLAGMPR